jgi:pimeloyl-ACP methyl ester carboxylesterase
MTAAPPVEPTFRDVPAWFAAALADRPSHRAVTVAGTRVTYRVWGRPGLPGLVLVHGGAAHSGWWDHVAPLLATHRVVAPDLSGYGDSGHRDAYDMSTWAREVVEVAAAEELDRPVLVAHSKGGWAAITAGVEHPDHVAGVVVVDSPLHTEPPDEAWLRRRRSPRRVYPSKEAAAARFVTLPPQDVVLPYVQANIAEQSVRAVEGGWTWKFDPRTFSRVDDQRRLLSRLTVPMAYLRCEHGLVSAAMAEEIAGLLPRRPVLVPIAGAGHHPMLDNPLALVTGLRTLLALWPDGDPR